MILFCTLKFISLYYYLSKLVTGMYISFMNAPM